MLKVKKFAGPNKKIAAFMRGIIISVAMLLAVSLILSIVTEASSDPSAVMGIYSLLSIILSAALSGITVSTVSGEHGIKISALCALMIVLIMMLTGTIVNGGGLPTRGLMNYLCYFAIYLFSALLGKPGKKRRKHRK